MPSSSSRFGKVSAGLRSFTLIEMLVSISVFSLMLLLMAQMIQMIDSAWRTGQSRVDNFTRARALLDVAAQDIQRGVFRPDLPAFANSSGSSNSLGMMVLTNSGTSTNAFYTRRPGISASSVRDVSLVVYALNVTAASAELQRGDYAVPWAAPSGGWANYLAFQTNLSTSMANIPAANYYNTANGVVGFGMVFQRADGSTTNFYSGDSSNPVTAVGIGVAVVDTQTLQKLISAGQLLTLNSALAGALTGTNSIKADWDTKLNTASFYSAYPKQLGTGLKTFERYVTCEPSF